MNEKDHCIHRRIQPVLRLLRSSKNKWLDVVAFANSLLPRLDEHEILAVKYFTARVNYDPAEPTAQMRHHSLPNQWGPCGV